MNKVILMGNLVKDIELKTHETKNGKSFNTANFTIAVPREYVNKDGVRPADFIDVIGYDVGNYKIATNLAKFFKKGSKILICGRLEVDEYVNTKNVKVRKPKVKIEAFDFCEKKNLIDKIEGMNDAPTLEYDKWYSVEEEAEMMDKN